MKRSKRLLVLLGVLAVACAATLVVWRMEEEKEQIKVSGEVVLEIPADQVITLSWDYEDTSLAFHKDETWLYDGDEAFPVSEEAVEALLDQFSAFSAAFTIEEPEDLGQYGLSDPLCTIEIATEEETYEILLGDYSAMDSQRYVSTGDGNVYLAATDPLDAYDVTLEDMIQHDDTPYFDQISAIRFTGADDYEIFYEEDNTAAWREEDVYFTEQDGADQPLDAALVEDYLLSITSLDLTDYVTYNATEEEIAACGLDDPELTVAVDYTSEDEEGETVSDTLTLSISRDPEELAALADQTEEETEDTEEEEEITAYARVGDSQILYQISGSDYEALMAASYDDLRHQEILPGDFEHVTGLTVTLEGETYPITSEGDGEDRVFSYGEEELDVTELQSALEALTAEEFTDASPAGKEEIRLTVTFDLENHPQAEIVLYRQDGSTCLAEVDGRPVALVERPAAVDLIEAVNAIVLQ